MRLVGIYKGDLYHPARGLHDGIPYRIVEERGRFLLERTSIMIGAGLMACPVGFFEEGWTGIYSSEE
jgi:hypothetical protein